VPIGPDIRRRGGEPWGAPRPGNRGERLVIAPFVV